MYQVQIPDYRTCWPIAAFVFMCIKVAIGYDGPDIFQGLDGIPTASGQIGVQVFMRV